MVLHGIAIGFAGLESLLGIICIILTDFIMRMSREEIGNYLGLTLETVSRLFSRFAKDGLIRVSQREVRILDILALRDLLGRD